MRSFLLIFCTLLVLLAAMGLYALWQGGDGGAAPRDRPQVRADPVAPLPGDGRAGVIGPGERPWFNRYNERAELASRFRAARYEPRGSAAVEVLSPVLDFFLDNGQVLRIQGQRGEITVDEVAGADPALRLTHGQVPNRGEFRDVLITLFSTLPEEAGAAQLTLRVENAAFDNDTFRVYSESYTAADGRRVARDQVPVRLRSSDYDFDGRGLIIRWNERDQYLEYVEITHGERLLVRNDSLAAQLRPPSSQHTGREPDPGAAPAPAATPRPGEAGEHLPPAMQEPLPTQRLYRATFHENVRIRQGDATPVEANLLHAIFNLYAPTAHAPAEPGAAVEPLPPGHAGSQQAQAPDSQIQTSQPLVVEWSGKLTLLPEPAGPELAVVRGDAVVEIEGTPLRLRWQGSDLSAEHVRFHTADSAMSVRGGPQHPVELVDAGGRRFVTESFQYLPAESRAILRGGGLVEFSDASDPPAATRAQWQRSATLMLLPNAPGRLTIERAVLEENVRITHPQLTLDTQTLDLLFDPGTEQSGQPHLRRLVATGNARAQLLDAEQQQQRAIGGDRLVVETITQDGRVYPRQIVATGSAMLSDAQQQLQANEVTIDLEPVAAAAPADQPSRDMGLSRLRANGNVTMSGGDGTSGRGDALDVRIIDGRPRIELSGDPLAELAAGDNLVQGRQIVLLPEREEVQVHGPGLLRAMRRDDPSAPGRPAEVAWDHQAMVDLLSNRVDIAGDVHLAGTEADGSMLSGRSQRVRVDLADRPDATPAGEHQPSDRRPPAAVPPAMASLGHKVIHTITFEQAVELSSTETAADGRLLRRTHLFCEELRYVDLTGAVHVPGPGRILHEDHRADARVRGATAFQWTQELSFDPQRDLATMRGRADAQAGHRGVLIVHRADGQEEAFRMTAPLVEAELKRPGDTDLTRASPAEAAPGGGRALHRLAARDGVRFSTAGRAFEGDSMEYLADREIVIVRGSPVYPARAFDADGIAQGGFEELRYHLADDRLEMRGVDGAFSPSR